VDKAVHPSALITPLLMEVVSMEEEVCMEAACTVAVACMEADMVECTVEECMDKMED